MPPLAMLLPIARGAGGGFAPTRIPPASGWTRHGSNPIVVSTVAWEETSVGEVSIIYEGGTWKMWYTGGWANPAIGYATSVNGIGWTKYASNPVLGQGGSGVAGMAVRGNVFKVVSTYWCYYADANPNANLKVTTSSDGIAWAAPTTAIASGAVGGSTGWANSTVWVEGSTWYMLAEGRSGSIWEIWHFTSSDGLVWTVQNSGNPLTTLQVVSGGMYGGPHVIKRGSTYHCWYHAAAASGNLPTNIYHATSVDRITWAKTAGAVLTHLGTGFEIDQIADPCPLIVNGTAYLFYEGVDNPDETAKIGVATAVPV